VARRRDRLLGGDHFPSKADTASPIPVRARYRATITPDPADETLTGPIALSSARPPTLDTGL